MAKESKTQETRTSIDELNESLSGLEQRVEQNKKSVIWYAVALLVVIGLGLGYYYGKKSAKEDAGEMIGKADIELMQGNDSVALAQYQAVAAEYSNGVANRANLNAAILLYQKGKYEEALKAVENYDVEEELVGAASQSLKGDCLVNLKKYDEAVAAYDEAISVANGNELYAPVFMMKKATVLSAQQKYSEAAAIYQNIKDNYSKYVNAYRVNIDKYIDRSNYLAGNKSYLTKIL